MEQRGRIWITRVHGLGGRILYAQPWQRFATKSGVMTSTRGGPDKTPRGSSTLAWQPSAHWALHLIASRGRSAGRRRAPTLPAAEIVLKIFLILKILTCLVEGGWAVVKAFPGVQGTTQQKT